MKKNLIILIAFILTVFITFVFSMWFFDTTAEPEDYIKHQLKSEVLNENRDVIVHLPESYQVGLKYPTIYVIGGNSLTYGISNDTDILSRTGYFKESIVVGIPNINTKTRQRDFTPPGMKQDLDEKNSPEGKADEYLSFIEKEVIPYIEKTYSTDTTKILVGHSRAGMTVLYSLIQNPNLFTGRICISPALWREDNIIVKRIEQYISMHQLPKSYLFLSLGTKEVDKMRDAFDEMNTAFSKSNQPFLLWDKYDTPNADHNNNAKLSAAIGLKKMLEK